MPHSLDEGFAAFESSTLAGNGLYGLVVQVIKSYFSIALICTTSRRIPASASANPGYEEVRFDSTLWEGWWSSNLAGNGLYSLVVQVLITASKLKRNNSHHFEDFHLKARARIWRPVVQRKTGKHDLVDTCWSPGTW